MPRQIATCRGCGCTDVRACPGGCWWLEVDYETGEGWCSNCGHRRRRAEGGVTPAKKRTEEAIVRAIARTLRWNRLRALLGARELREVLREVTRR